MTSEQPAVSEGEYQMARDNYSRRRMLQSAGVATSALGALTVIACGGGDDKGSSGGAPASGSSSSNAGGGSKPIAQLNIGLGDDVQVVDPAFNIGGVNQFMHQNLYDGLVGRDKDGKVFGRIADTWEVTDPLTYTFKVRPGMTFHDGSPITAEDVQFTFQHVADPSTPASKVTLAVVESVNVVDPQTVTFKLKKPDISFALSDYGIPAVMPKKYFATAGQEGFDKAPIGSGPYRLTDRKLKQEFTLERFDGYYGQKGTVVKATYKTLPDGFGRLAALQTGQIDIMQGASVQLLDEIRKNSNFEVALATSYTAPMFNLLIDAPKKNPDAKPIPAFKDKRVRQALNMGIDRDGIASKLWKGTASPWVVSVPTVPWGKKDWLEKYSLNKAKAKQLLGEAGYGSGLKLIVHSLLGERLPLMKESVEVVVSNFREMGIDVDLRPEEYQPWVSRVTVSVKGTTNEGVLYEWDGGSAISNPIQNYNLHYSSTGNHNNACYDPKYDEFSARLSSAPNVDEVYKIMREFGDFEADNVMLLYGYAFAPAYGVNKTKVRWQARAGQEAIQIVDIQSA